jgi:branched-chain amino acid transport system permease protein
VRLHHVEAQTFALAGMLCGIAGAIMALRYGVINFHSGTLLGFKALTAAILGGIGIIRGAWLGGLLLGVLESLWTGYFGDPYRDAAVFGLLAAVLILRPEGLFAIDNAPRQGR